MAPCQVIGAHDASFGAGLLDAMAQVMNDGEPVLLVAYDSEYPEPLFAKRNTPDCAGVAIMLSPYCTPKSLASISVRPTTQAAEQMPDENLDQLREKIPALRSLPLLSRIAQRQAATVIDPPIRRGGGLVVAQPQSAAGRECHHGQDAQSPAPPRRDNAKSAAALLAAGAF